MGAAESEGNLSDMGQVIRDIFEADRGSDGDRSV